ncbi:tRNA 2-selenouridine(34) synthase MnmH [Paracoccus luteus]|uniref:tRNA 2-selenouridine(34) synthase MnmH n=1 Tax=Paracoccus luteus TaxID=2508543 RepID=UPI00106F5AAC|nr:tRNA 2-selenouridine(34) synthase MnmH [Paracoccus luteus]
MPAAFRPGALADLAAAGFDDVIDVRSPAEFAEDHLPGAINLPVLDDAQRAEVGTIYKQVSPFDARKIGGALVAANAARHIAGALSDRGGGWRPLAYCWRGGQRSGAFATILDQIGWRVSRLDGGWKTWRALVIDQVERRGFGAPVIVLDGNTGSGKTAILHRLAARGVQVVDLEGLANHRGSLFGAMPGGQPPQKLFETRLAMALAALDPARPVVVEAESSRIGERGLPRAVWQALCAAPRLRLDAPLAARADYTARSYAGAVAEPGRVADTVTRLAPLHPADRIAAWAAMAERGDWAALAQGLMRDHYDPRYRKHRDRYGDREAGVIAAPALDDAGLDRIAAEVERAVAGMGRDGGPAGAGAGA